MRSDSPNSSWASGRFPIAVASFWEQKLTKATKKDCEHLNRSHLLTFVSFVGFCLNSFSHSRTDLIHEFPIFADVFL